MNDDEVEVIRSLCNEIEEMLQAKIRQEIEGKDPSVLLNVLMNIGTSMVARALVALNDENLQQELSWMASEIIKGKVADGNAQMEAFTAINRAKFHFNVSEKKH